MIIVLHCTYGGDGNQPRDELHQHDQHSHLAADLSKPLTAGLRTGLATGRLASRCWAVVADLTTGRFDGLCDAFRVSFLRVGFFLAACSARPGNSSRSVPPGPG